MMSRLFTGSPTSTASRAATSRGQGTAELLVTHKIDKLITKESIAKESAFYVLEDAYVEFEETDAGTLEEIIEAIKI